ncbi:MAG: hypothetical protein CL681_02800 [Blastopirellula sp.]|nr:hypothetical protein [Blastopirellula sp.]
MKRFSLAEIELARSLQRHGVPWEPAAGHYVYDETGFCKQASPFQDRVFFILNYPYFMRTVGGVERFKKIMTWLPTWSDVRQLLDDQGVSAQECVQHLQEKDSLARGTERHDLLALLLANRSCS